MSGDGLAVAIGIEAPAGRGADATTAVGRIAGSGCMRQPSTAIAATTTRKVMPAHRARRGEDRKDRTLVNSREEWRKPRTGMRITLSYCGPLSNCAASTGRLDSTAIRKLVRNS